MRVRRRHRLKRKEIRRLSKEISEQLEVGVFTEDDVVDLGSSPDFDIIFVNGRILAMVYKGKAFLTVRGLLEYGARKRFVTVDMGAVGFIANGADVMGPGIIDVDPSIKEGDLVWIRDERNMKPLAVGEALASGPEMLKKQRGKMVLSITYVGDRLWRMEEG